MKKVWEGYRGIVGHGWSDGENGKRMAFREDEEGKKQNKINVVELLKGKCFPTKTHFFLSLSFPFLILESLSAYTPYVVLPKTM